MDDRSWIKSAQWIWLPGYVDDDNETPGKFVWFRKSFTWRREGSEHAQSLIHVSADTRYRLFINGKSAAFGPCKSYPEKWYYDTIDLSPFLVDGNNVIAAKVLRYSSAQLGCASMMRTNSPGFTLHGQVGVSHHTCLEATDVLTS